jgi:ubiquitin-like 1-activating enzyme E1 B
MATFGEIQSGNLGTNLYEKLENCKVLVVGAGGIGCELLKTLVLTGFNDIEVIDLDTIDVSNLNRQFLFQKQHVGKSKANVARESAIEFNPEAKIKAYHDSITSPDYDVNFFKKFSVVLNALDNRAARNHVNRMCLAAGVPLVESGTAGYLGQVTVIQKGETECYECQPKPHQKSFPGCTIRNTPSEPIHCIVWAKHLFNQLFGEADADEEVSPDAEDPEAVGDAGAVANNSSNDELQRVSTQDWAKSIGYEPTKLVQKFFIEDIKYLLSMDKLWKERKAPVPLDIENLNESLLPDNENGLPDQKIWTIKECIEKFHRCVELLKDKLAKKGDFLVWDKDDDASLDFVVSASNIRSHIFDIPRKSRFDVKSMAGNIIPAIATTNAVISGLIVLEALKALQGDIGNCQTVYLNKKPSVRKKLLQPSPLVAPNPKCYVCSTKPEAKVTMDCSKVTVKSLEDKLLKQQFGVIAPDVEIEDGKGTILISSEEGETDQNNSKVLSDFGITNGSRLKIDDFHQNYELVLNIVNCSNMADDEEFKILQDIEKADEEKDGTVKEVANEIMEGKGANEVIMDEVVNKEVKEVNKDSNRKRKASESFSDDPELTPKHARIDLTDDNELQSDDNERQVLFHANGSLVPEESERMLEPVTVIDVDALSEDEDSNSEPAVMVIDDDNGENLKVSWEKNGEKDEPVVVVLDDD